MYTKRLHGQQVTMLKYFTMPHFQVQKDPFTTVDTGWRCRGGQRPVWRLEKVLQHLLMMISIWCRKMISVTTKGDAADWLPNPTCSITVYLKDLVACFSATIGVTSTIITFRAKKSLSEISHSWGSKTRVIPKFNLSMYSRVYHVQCPNGNKWTCLLK